MHTPRRWDIGTRLLPQADSSDQANAFRYPTFAEYALDRKSTRLNSSHLVISYAVFCLKKKNYRQMSTSTPSIYFMYVPAAYAILHLVQLLYNLLPRSLEVVTSSLRTTTDDPTMRPLH